MLPLHETVGLDLAMRSLKSHEFLLRILHRGLESANASSIRRWLECVTPRLGIRRVLGELLRNIDQFPEGIGRTIYFLPGMVAPGDERGMRLLAALRTAAEARGLVRRPDIVRYPDGPGEYGPIE